MRGVLRESLLDAGDFGILCNLFEHVCVVGVLGHRSRSWAASAANRSVVEKVALRVLIEVEKVVCRFFEAGRCRAAK